MLVGVGNPIAPPSEPQVADYAPGKAVKWFFGLQLAACLALGTAWVGFVLRLYRQLRGGPPVGMGLDALWMGPLMNLIWIGTPAVVLALGARRWRGLANPVSVLTVLGFVAFAELLSPLRNIHWAAELLLALGLAVQMARVCLPYMDRIERSVARGARLIGPTYLFATAVLFGGRWMLELRAMAALPEPRPGAPNVLFVVLDTVRDFSMSLFGHQRETTPNLARWAAQGARFDRAFATSSWTLPSHASMFTGHYPSELSTWFAKPLDNTYPTLAEVLRDDGYATASFVGNVSYGTWQFGLTRGFVHASDYPINLSMFFWSSAISRRISGELLVRRLLRFRDVAGRRSAATVSDEFLEWSARLRNRPFFAFLNYYDAHHPYLPPPPFNTLFGASPAPSDPMLELSFRSLPLRQRLLQEAQYEGAIAYVDAQLDRLLAELQQRGILDNTVVVITADHGEHWGDHGRLSHGNSLYRQLLQVPLVLRFPPRISAGITVNLPVSLRDLPATVLDVAASPRASQFPGTSLIDRAVATAAGPLHDTPLSPVLSENRAKGVPGAVSLIAENFHYIRDPKSGEELYDLERDSRDSVDLAKTLAGTRSLERARALIDSVLRVPN